MLRSCKVWVGVLGVVLGVMAQAQVISISEGGTPGYSQAIAVPPGTAGMSPNIGLIYSGGGVNGPVGYGWSIQGISTITRCGNTKAIDGNVRAVAYTSEDKLCLDGQRLIQTDATGAPVAFPQSADSLGGTGQLREYRTEKDTYARIRAYGSAAAGAAAGPQYFRVWTKSGQIYEYGNYSNTTAKSAITIPSTDPKAGVVTAWAVSRISDTLGNFIDFQYQQPDTAWGSGPTAGPTQGHEWNLQEIRYTGNGVQNKAATNKVSFVYEDRTAETTTTTTGKRQDRQEAYHLGSKNVSIQRLTKIQTYVNTTGTPVKVKTTKLTYDNGGITNRSRVKTLTECAGPAETACLPVTTFNYQDGGNEAYVASTTFNLQTSPSGTPPLLDSNSGVITGDFNGDGKTDLLIWSNTPASNQLWLSNGDGSFTKAGNFNITSTYLNKSDQCYYTVVNDFNGDGVTDILRVARATAPSGATCATDSTLLFIGNADGSFQTPIALSTAIDLSTATEVYTSTQVSCTYVNLDRPILLASADSGLDIILAAASPCYDRSKTTGKNFYFIDVNGDGIPDIVTTINPSYTVTYQSGNPNPTSDQLCATMVCTHVYLGSTTGQFTEATATNLAHHSVYSSPPSNRNNLPRPPNVADVNGDGLADLMVSTGTWISRGSANGDFDKGQGSWGCTFPIDFNGDGRADCYGDSPADVTQQKLYPGDGSYSYLTATASFNLNTAGNELSRYLSGTTTQDIGNTVVDVNGDGRQDFIRWADDPTKNALFLSNGDGSFTQSSTFNFNTTTRPLRKSDGSYDFIVGDFTGRGNVEILRLKTSPVAGIEGMSNQLYVKADATPADSLVSAVSASGLKTTLTWVPLTNSSLSNLYNAVNFARYKSDRSDPPNKAVYPRLDIIAPMYVVGRSVSDTGVGTATVATEYAYTGLKASFDGRGAQGFRETRRQSYGPNGQPLTVVTQYLQDHPYTGVAIKSETWNGPLDMAAPSTPLSRSTYVYCDIAAAGSAAAATPTAPCASTAKIQHPYVYKSTEEGTDLSGTALPTVVTTNTFNASGDPTQIVVSTAGTSLGLAQTQTFTKTTTNLYYTDITSADNWVLGRLQKSTQANSVPNLLASIATVPGSAANASATQGTGTPPGPIQLPPPPIPTAALMSIIQMLLLD